MDKLTLCRGCLNRNGHYTIKNTPLEEVYENLTRMRFQTPDTRPLSVCYMCYAQLLKSHKFMLKCQKADHILIEIMMNKFVDTKEIDDKAILKDRLSLSSALSVSPIVTTSSTDSNKSENVLLCTEIKKETADEQDVASEEQAPVTESSEAIIRQNTIVLEEKTDEQEQSLAVGCKSEETHDTRDTAAATGDQLYHEEYLDEHVYEVPVEIEPALMSQVTKSKADRPKDSTWKNVDTDMVRPEGSVSMLFNENYISPIINNSKANKQNNIDKKHNNTVKSNSSTESNNISKLYLMNPKNIFNVNLLKDLYDSVPYNDKIAKIPNTSDLVRKSRQKSDLDADVPTSEESFTCNVCNLNFRTKYSLKLHVRTHNDANHYSCNMCDKRFLYKSSLLRHSLVHKGDPFMCKVCGKLFFQKDHLICHTRIHTGDRPYSCSVCNKQFTQQSSLARHRRIHTGEKPYSCDVCDKSFNQKGSLDDHARTHTGERPFSCITCKKKFSRKGELHRHVVVHAGGKNYICNICNKSFTAQGSLRRHHAQSHRKES